MVEEQQRVWKIVEELLEGFRALQGHMVVTEYAIYLESLHQYLCEEMAAAKKRYQGPADA